MIYVPKGGMCFSCQNSGRICSYLDFSKMPVIEKDSSTKNLIVRCTEFLPKEKS